MVHLYRSSSTAQLFIISFVIFLVPIHANYRHHVSHSGIRSADVVSPDDFVNELFEKYGSNGSLDSKQLKTMFKNLGIGRDNEKTSSNHASVNERVSSTLLATYYVTFNIIEAKTRIYSGLCLKQLQKYICRVKIFQNFKTET